MMSSWTISLSLEFHHFAKLRPARINDDKAITMNNEYQNTAGIPNASLKLAVAKARIIDRNIPMYPIQSVVATLLKFLIKQSRALSSVTVIIFWSVFVNSSTTFAVIFLSVRYPPFGRICEPDLSIFLAC